MAANIISQLSTANTFQHWLGSTQSLIGTANLLTNGNGEAFFANTMLIIGGSAANVSLNVETGATINILTGNTVNTVNTEVREFLVTGNLFAKTSISMNTGSGVFQTNEIVFQGPDNTLANANAIATVHNWNTTTNTLSLIKVTGNFIQDANTYGATSTAVWTTINTASGFSFTKPNVAIPSNVIVEKELYVRGNTFIVGDLNVTGNLTLDEIGFDDLSVSGSANIANNLTVYGNTVLQATTIANANVAILSGTANTAIYNAIVAAESSALAFSIALG